MGGFVVAAHSESVQVEQYHEEQCNIALPSVLVEGHEFDKYIKQLVYWLLITKVSICASLVDLTFD